MQLPLGRARPKQATASRMSTLAPRHCLPHQAHLFNLSATWPGHRRRDGSDSTRAPRRDYSTLARLPARIGPNNTNTCGDDTSAPDGFQAWLLAVRAAVLGFGGRPVVYVHGDSHYFRVDKPLLDRNGEAPGRVGGRGGWRKGEGGRGGWRKGEGGNAAKRELEGLSSPDDRYIRHCREGGGHGEEADNPVEAAGRGIE